MIINIDTRPVILMGNVIIALRENSVQHPVMVKRIVIICVKNCVLEQSILATPTFWYKQVLG